MRGWDRYFLFGAAAGLADSVAERTIGTEQGDLLNAFLFKPASWALIWPIGVGDRIARRMVYGKVYN